MAVVAAQSPVAAHAQYRFGSLLVLFVEPKVDERIVTNGGDAKPMAGGEDRLGVGGGGHKVQVHVVQIEGQPTDGKDYDYEDEHLDGSLACLQVAGHLRMGHGTDVTSLPDVNTN